MAHKTLIGGTAYEIGGGKTLVNGTAYSIDKGKTLVGGTAYEVGFGGNFVCLCDLGTFNVELNSNQSVGGYTKSNIAVDMFDYNKVTHFVVNGDAFECIYTVNYNIIHDFKLSQTQQLVTANEPHWIRVMSTQSVASFYTLNSGEYTVQLGYFEE